MATNVVSAVRLLAEASKKPGHKLHGAVITPAQWATEAGFPGSKASPMRAHMARQSNNGCGRNGRYGSQDAVGMLRLLDLGDTFANADTKAKQAVVAKRVRAQLTAKQKAKAASKAKTVQRKKDRAAKIAEAEAAPAAQVEEVATA